MQQFITAWVEMEINKQNAIYGNIQKIRVGCFKNEGTEALYMQYYHSLNEHTDYSHRPYELWGNIDFNKALGMIVRLLAEKYSSGFKVKNPEEGIYDFYLD